MKLRPLSAVCTAIYIYSNAVMAVSFMPLGDLGGGGFRSEAHDVSADGSVVVGESYSDSGNQAFRWTREYGMVGLGDLPGGEFYSEARGVSADGSVVVGVSDSASADYSAEAFRWTREGGMVGLGYHRGDYPDSKAYDVSADGSVVVGSSANGVCSYGGGCGSVPFRWTSATGMVALGCLECSTASTAYGVSADGSVVVGTDVSTGKYDTYAGAFRWTSEDGMENLGLLPGAYYFMISAAHGVSADGSVVVGMSNSASGYQAFRWTSEDGMVGLGYLPGSYFSSSASDVSADGSVVVGNSESASGDEAFRWTRRDGMQSVASILTTAGVDLAGWTLESANGVSADGYAIVGVGTNPDGFREAWLADLTPPTTPVDLSGTIKTPDGTDICAIVLASGQYIFSCNPVGVFSLEDLPREGNGTVKCQMYADGFLPEINYLVESTSEAFVMTPADACPNYNIPYDPAFVPGSAGKEIYITGQVLLEHTQTPVCAMVLANGRYMFSCDGTGSYFLKIPLDNNGQFKLQAYADGFAPSIRTFDEFKTTNIVRMTPGVDCQ